jgi:hypothetical protein
LELDLNGSASQLFQLSDEVTHLGVFPALVEVVTAQFLVWLSIGQDVPGTGEHRTRNGYDGPFSASPRCQTMIACLQESVFEWMAPTQLAPWPWLECDFLSASALSNVYRLSWPKGTSGLELTTMDVKPLVSDRIRSGESIGTSQSSYFHRQSQAA